MTGKLGTVCRAITITQEGRKALGGPWEMIETRRWQVIYACGPDGKAKYVAGDGAEKMTADECLALWERGQ